MEFIAFMVILVFFLWFFGDFPRTPKTPTIRRINQTPISHEQMRILQALADKEDDERNKRLFQRSVEWNTKNWDVEYWESKFEEVK